MSRTPWKYHARQGEESHLQAQTPVQDQRNAVWPAARNSGVRPFTHHADCSEASSSARSQSSGSKLRY
jgi:hypothetical protein